MARKKKGESAALRTAKTSMPVAAPLHESPEPSYEGNLFWGSAGACIGIVLAVVAAMVKDLGWLLWFAFPFGTVACWAFSRSIQSAKVRGVVKFGAPVLLACSLIWLNYALKPTAIADGIPGEVIAIFTEPFYRFYQHPPVACEALDTALFVSVTNRSGRNLYIRGYSVEALVDSHWVHFKNAQVLGVDQYSFGLIAEGRYAADLDLSKNGFDFVMQSRPLGNDEDFESWMFFNSGLRLHGKELQRIKKFKVSLRDSAGREYGFESPFPTPRGTTIVIPGQIAFGPKEDLPLGLKCQ